MARKIGASLHTRDDFVKFAMYWPRKSAFPDWWRQLDLGNITFADVAADLDQMVSVLGINTVRVFTYYDHVYRNSTTTPRAVGFTDGLGNHNPVYRDYLSTFIDMAAARGLDVIVTMYQLLPALRVEDDWDFLEDDIAHYESFHSYILTMLNTKRNVKCYNLINEPDGYGVWDNQELGGRVMTFLSRLKGVGKAVAPRLSCVVNTTTDDNNIRRFPTAPAGHNTVYELSDVLAMNSFLWVDNGNASAKNYRKQVDFINTINVARKPILMTECGHPAHYAQQGVAGSPIVDEDGNAVGGTYAVTEDSIVPQGGSASIFDRPKGTAFGIPHTPENQARSVAEAAYWVFVHRWAGFGVWAAFDHANPDLAYVYRDAFGVIDENGIPLPAAGIFKAALAGVYDNEGEFRMSLCQGTVAALPSRINGLTAWNSDNPEQNTIGGVYLHNGGGVWTSDQLLVGVPTKIRIDFNLREANTVDEPLVMRFIFAGRTFDFRYKVYDVSAWQILDLAGEVNHGFSQTVPLLTGANSFVIDLAQSLTPQITFNGVLLNFSVTAAGPLTMLTWQPRAMRVNVRNNGNSPIDITSMRALGTAGAPIPFELRATPSGPPGVAGPQGPVGAPGLNGAVGPAFLVASVSGTLTAGVSTARFYNDTGRTLTVNGVRATVGTPATGSSVIVDIHKNGSTIFTTQANRPTVAADDVTSGRVTNMNDTVLLPGDFLTCEVDQVGSTTAGANLTVQVEVA